MNSFKLSTVFVFLFVLIGACAGQDAPSAQEMYALRFRDGHTEGAWVLALHNGIQYEVTAFTKESNDQAVKALAALNPEIVRLNTSPEYNIYLIGHLDTQVSKLEAGHIPKAILRLDGWYLKAPFYVPSIREPDGPINICNTLTAEHFLPTGERNDSEATRKFRAHLRIRHNKRLNLFWVGVDSPFTKFISMEERTIKHTQSRKKKRE